jgi:hypothetical protein
MDLKEKRARWAQMLAQAGDFADADNTGEAVARARTCLSEIESARAAATSDERPVLEREKKRASERLAGFERAHEEWNARVAERAARFLEHEKRAYASPLPKKGV